MTPHDSRPQQRVRDAQLSRAYLDLETAMNDLRRMCALVDIIAEDTVLRLEDSIADNIHRTLGLDGYHIHILTKDQNSALDYALRHTSGLIRSLYDSYNIVLCEEVA